MKQNDLDYKKLLYLLLISFVSVVLLTACNLLVNVGLVPNEEEVEKPLAPILYGEPCSPPCWYGLTPGVSTQEDVLTVIQNLSFLRKDTVNITPAGVIIAEDGQTLVRTAISVQCIFSSDFSCISFRLVGGRLDSISMDGNGSVTLGNVSDSLGQPHFVVANPANTPRFVCRVEVIWLEAQLTALYIERDSKDAEKFCYSAPAGLRMSRSFVVDAFFYSTLPPLDMLQMEESSFPWPGFSE